ncbi:ester cyclase [Microbispora sp. NPDC049125]|uniref:ester cyclase n=1 Tax=Microbispora sp. NPDC049125 TaxID=3154929 RepID=UPI003466172D
MTATDVVRGLFDAINDRRLGDLRRYMADDVIDHNKIIYGEPDEPGAAFDALKQQLAAFDPMRLTVEETIADGDRVAVRLTMSGTNSGSHPRMPEPTHRSFQVEAVFVLTLKDGKVSEMRAVSDRLGLFLQLGWDWPEAG